MKLVTKLFLFFIPLTLLFIGVVVVKSRSSMHGILLNEAYLRGLSQVSGNAQAFSRAFEAGTESSLLPLLQSLKEQTNGVQAAAFDQSGRVITHTNVAEKNKTYTDALTIRMLRSDIPVFQETVVNGEESLVISAPVWSDEEEKDSFLISAGDMVHKRRLGTIISRMSLVRTLQLENRLFFRQISLLIISVGGLSLGLLAFTIWIILRPLGRLAVGITKVSKGQYGTLVPVSSNDELGQLAGLFNRMTETLVNTTVSRDRLSVEVAERKRAEEALLYSDARFRQVSSQSGDWIWETDAEGRYTYSSPVVETILGYKPEELIGRRFYDLFAPGEKERLTEACKAAFARKEILTRLPNLNLHKNGQEVILETTASPVVSDSGTLLGYRGIDRDITERRKLEAAMLQSEKLSAVGQLAAGVAHEINNPLGIILGFAQSVVKRIKEGDPLTLPLKTIEREAVRCKNLVQNLLVFSRASKGDRQEEVDVNAVMDGALSLVLAQTKTHSVELVSELGAGLPKIRANQTQIQQVVINLANNAIDAMPNGGILTIRTALAENPPGHVEIRVRDTGTGIPKNLQKKIFDPFFTTKEVGKGTGLGLSLVYEMVHKHGGDIALSSEEGKGTEFTISLPVHLATKP